MWKISFYKFSSRLNIYMERWSCRRRLLLTLMCDKYNYCASQDHNGVHLTQRIVIQGE